MNQEIISQCNELFKIPLKLLSISVKELLKETIENNIRYIYLDKISWMSKMAQMHTVNFYCMLTTLNVMLVYVAKSYQIGPFLTEHNNFCAYTHIQNLVVFTIIM